MDTKFDPDELLESLGGGSKGVSACTWSSMPDLYYQVYDRVRAGQPAEHIAGALDIPEAMAKQIGELMCRWFAGESGSGHPRSVWDDKDPIFYLASVASLLSGSKGAISAEHLTLLKTLLARAKAKRLPWARIYEVATSVRLEGSPPAPPVEDVRPR